jgi:FkbM family methyltransferase
VLTTSRLKNLIAARLLETAAYNPLRRIYHGVFNRQYLRLQRVRQEFYSQFIAADSLVFDIGANRGELAEVFLQLGANVVAVEPNPACCKRMLALGYKGRLTIRCEAAGDHQGELTLFTATHDRHSTVSEEWMDSAAANDPGFKWNGSIKVPLNTLDDMRAQYGVPDFVKIDVEGYEIGVLQGMHFRPQSLGFEFHAFSLTNLEKCLALPVFDSNCVFNLSLGESWRLIWDDWRSKRAVRDYVSALPSSVFGDVYAHFSPDGKRAQTISEIADKTA